MTLKSDQISITELSPQRFTTVIQNKIICTSKTKQVKTIYKLSLCYAKFYLVADLFVYLTPLNRMLS
jgi:hypothetical protein